MFAGLTLFKFLVASTLVMGGATVATAVVTANDGENSASSRLASHLSLDVSRVEKPENELPEDSSPELDLGGDSTDQPSSENTNDNSGSNDSAGNTEDSKPSTKDIPEILYTVKEGDTYGCIAEARYGSFEHWTDIVSVNPTYQEGFGEYELHVGAQIILPAISSGAIRPASNLCT